MQHKHAGLIGCLLAAAFAAAYVVSAAHHAAQCDAGNTCAVCIHAHSPISIADPPPAIEPPGFESPTPVDVRVDPLSIAVHVVSERGPPSE